MSIHHDNAGNQVSETIRRSTAADDDPPVRRARPAGRRDRPRGNVAGANPAAFTTEFRNDESERQVAVTLPAGRRPRAARDDRATGDLVGSTPSIRSRCATRRPGHEDDPRQGRRPVRGDA
ncbi:hypothetical protein K7G98_13920 [Saccharothrix sp. MB29]|nr:hypothetical protein [Saccharothrix sp. MB29]